MATNKTTAVKIAEQRAKMEQMGNEIKRLLRLQKDEERRARTHRLCERGGIVEKLLPDLARLDKEQFDIFVQKTLLTGFAEKVLRGLVPSEPGEQKDTVQDSDGAAKLASATQNVSANNNAETSTAARQAG